MKKLTLAFSLCILYLFSFSQSTSGFGSLNFKTFSVKVFSDGTILNFEKNDTVNKPLIYASHIWLRGLDNSSAIKFAGQTYGNRADYVPGPISTDPNAVNKYDRVWQISSQDISDFINNPGGNIPSSISDWPAHGNANFNEAANLAPFVDVNNDGLYDPAQGDYPCIKGDEAIFFIFNDFNGLTADMGIEIHGMLYAFEGGGYLDSTFYIDYTIYNRSNNSYSDARIGVFADFDIGGSGDDVMGTEVSRNAIYAYNGDFADSQPGTGFRYSLGSSAIVWLKGPKADVFDGTDNDKDGCIDGVIDANGLCAAEDPVNEVHEHWKLFHSFAFDAFSSVNPEANPSQFDDLLNNRCPNGFDKEFSGNGFGIWSTLNDPVSCLPTSGTKVSYCYTGNSFDTSSATIPSSDLNWFQPMPSGNDVRTFAGAGDFSLTTLEPIELHIAHTWHQADSTQSRVDAGLSGLFRNIDQINASYPLVDTTCRSFNIGLTEKEVKAFNYYYNPLEKNIVIENLGKETLLMQVYDLAGQKLAESHILPTNMSYINAASFPSGVYILREVSKQKAVKMIIH